MVSVSQLPVRVKQQVAFISAKKCATFGSGFHLVAAFAQDVPDIRLHH